MPLQRGLQLPVAALRLGRQLATLRNLDCLSGLVTRALGHILDLLNHIIALEDLTKHNVAAIEPAAYNKLATAIKQITTQHIRSDRSGDEELGPVGILAGVGHACSTTLVEPPATALECGLHTQEPLAGVSDLEVLVRELGAVDRLSAGACHRELGFLGPG